MSSLCLRCMSRMSRIFQHKYCKPRREKTYALPSPIFHIKTYPLHSSPSFSALLRAPRHNCAPSLVPTWYPPALILQIFDIKRQGRERLVQHRGNIRGCLIFVTFSCVGFFNCLKAGPVRMLIHQFLWCSSYASFGVFIENLSDSLLILYQ